MNRWDRQPGEPSRAYGLFNDYLMLGAGRSLSRLAHTGTASLSYLKQLSTRWQWRERTAAWQAHVAQIATVNAPEGLHAIRERQLRDARTLRALGRAQARRHLHRGRPGEHDGRRRLTGHEVARMWETGFRTEHDLITSAPAEGAQDLPVVHPWGQGNDRDVDVRKPDPPKPSKDYSH